MGILPSPWQPTFVCVPAVAWPTPLPVSLFPLPSLAVLASHATYDGHLRCGGFAVCVVLVVVFLALPVVLCVPRPWCPAYGHRYGAVFSGESV